MAGQVANTRSSHTNENVALKIFDVRNLFDARNEVVLHERLPDTTPESKHVVSLLRFFAAPTGRVCLVYPAMGRCLGTIIPWREAGDIGRFNGLPRILVRRILRQTLLGLLHLHRHGIVHGDLHSGNVLFSSNVSGKELDMHSLVAQDPQLRFLAYMRTEVKLIDLGGGFLTTEHRGHLTTPLCSRAPEVLVGLPVDEKIDIWAFGCLAFRLLTGTSAFQNPLRDTIANESDDLQLLAIREVTGELPSELLTAWPRARSWLDENGQLVRLLPSSDNPRVANHPLAVMLWNRKPDNMCTEELVAFGCMLRHIFRYPPSDRPSAEELLRAKWFQREYWGNDSKW